MSPGTTTLIEEEKPVKYYAVLEKKTVKVANGRGSYSSKISLPQSWTGKKVLCLLLEEPEEKKS